MKKLLALFLALGLVISITGHMSKTAAITVYTTEADFVAILDTYYLEDFDEYTFGSYIGPSLSLGPVNGYSYTMSAVNDLFSGDSNMSTNDPTDPLEVNFTGDPITAVGGLFWPTDFWGDDLVGNVYLELVDGGTYNYSLIDADSLTFVGFSSDVPLTSMSITADSLTYYYPTVDHFYVGTPFSVPEPATMLLLGSGLVGFLGFRKKFRK
jgi:hypothetical protein